MGIQCNSIERRKRINHRKTDDSSFSTSTNTSVIYGKNVNIHQENNNLYEILLNKHNYYRKFYNSPELELNDDLCKLAQEYADKCADLQSTDLSPVLYENECIGESISELNGDISTSSTICDEWAQEKKDFDFRSKIYNGKAKHFTQMIWKNTRSVGFGFSSSNNKNYFVSFYFPAGNIFDEFEKNT